LGRLGKTGRLRKMKKSWRQEQEEQEEKEKEGRREGVKIPLMKSLFVVMETGTHMPRLCFVR